MQISWDNAAASVTVDPVVFLNMQGVQADPSSLTFTWTDPIGDSFSTTNSVNPPGSPNAIVKTSTGNYAITLTNLSVPGLYVYTWVGTGNGVNQVTAGTFRIVPLDGLSGMGGWYCGLSEFKSRNGITGTQDDYEITQAIQAASGWINRYCGTHFNQVLETRTFPVENIYYMPIDQVVTIYTLKLDYDGDGVFETTWTAGNNYQLYREGETYNQNYAGVKRPFDLVKCTLGTPVSQQGGAFFPFVWPFTHNDRVQINATWGWPEVPPEVTHACLILSTQLFREKDSPWGTVGAGEMGVIRTSPSPFLIELLRPFKFPRKTVGI